MVTRRTFMKSLGLSALAPAALSALSADETPRSPALEAKTLRLVQYCDPQLGFGEEGFGPSLDRFHIYIMAMDRGAWRATVHAKSRI